MTEEQSKLEETLLKISNSNINEIDKLFYEAAEELLLKSKLTNKISSYYILEIEFYFTSDWHKDPYAHYNKNTKSSNIKRQLEFGLWYFHRFNPTQYTGPRKGLDLTFGSREKGTSGGILIRKLQRIKTSDKPIDGISKIVDALKIDIGEEGIRSVAKLNAYAFSKESLLKIEPLFPIRNEKIELSKRKKLNIKEDVNGFFDRFYNFSIK